MYAVHDDKEHCHLHIIYNSINMLDGKKYHYNKGDWKYVMQPITNALFEKYGLAIMPAEYSREKTNVPRDEWQHDRVFSHFILDNARYCLSIADDEDHFIWLMERLGYSVKTGVHLAVKAPGMKRYKRLDTLDKAFARDVIEESIAKAHDDDIRMEEFTFDPEPYFKIGMCGLQKKYYGYMVRMRKVEMKMDEISEEQQSIYKANADAKKRCREAKDLPEFQRVHLANERRLLELKKKKKELRSELKTAGELTEEMELSIAEVFLEEGWMYGDYSRVPDQPEAPEYPYHKKNLEDGEIMESPIEKSEVVSTKQRTETTQTDIMPQDLDVCNLEVTKNEAEVIQADWAMSNSEEMSATNEEKEVADEDYSYGDSRTSDLAELNRSEESGRLPDCYSEFMKLSYEEKAARLCKAGEDADNILYLLNEYAQSVGHKFWYFDELINEAELIRKALDERNVKGKAEKIVDRLTLSGITDKNFMSTDPRKIAVCFGSTDNDLNEMSKQFHEVISLLDLRAGQQELFQKFMEVYDKVSEVTSRKKGADAPEKQWDRDSRGR